MSKVSLIFSIILCAACVAEESDVSIAQKGERQLSASDAAAKLTEISERFQKNPSIKARIVTTVDDLIGPRTEEGDLLLDGTTMLRRFTKPSNKAWLLTDSQLFEYSEKQKTVHIKDFSRAPKALKLIQAAVKVDFKVLEERFDVRVFEGENAALRIALLRKNDAAQKSLYKSIQAKIRPGQPFFDEIEYVPESGDKTVEKYFEITPIPKPKAEDFDLKLPADVVKKTLDVGELE